MFVNVQDLPASARQPLLLALRYQAIATAAKTTGHIHHLGFSDGVMAKEFTTIVNDAVRNKIIPGDPSPPVEESSPALEKVADFLWSIGLAWLQNAIMDGSWTPSELDLSIRPKDDPILNAKPKYQGKGIISGVRPAGG